MSFDLELRLESFPIKGSFSISRGSKTAADVVTCIIKDGTYRGWGECVPYRRYGETLESVRDQIEAARPAIERGITRDKLQKIMPPGAARNAVDCALWDLEAKQNSTPVSQKIDAPNPSPLVTAYTISLGEPDVMAAQARTYAHRALLKVKIGTSDDASRIRAVREAAPDAALILDANEGWHPDSLAYHFDIAANAGVSLIEQPLPAGQDAALANVKRTVPVCADESVHHTGDLESLRDRYDAINIKLDKTGGLTEALMMKKEVQRLGFQLMVGCMVGTSLAMAPAILLAQDAQFVDLDGPLLLAKDREPGIRYAGSLVYPPETVLWG